MVLAMFQKVLLPTLLISGTIFGSFSTKAPASAATQDRQSENEWQDLITPQIVSFSILAVGLSVVGVGTWQQQRKSSEVKRLSNVQKAILVHESQRQTMKASQPVTPELNWFLEEVNPSPAVTQHKITDVLDSVLPNKPDQSWFLDESQNTQPIVLPTNLIQTPVTAATAPAIVQSTISRPPIQNAVSQFAAVQSVLGLTHSPVTTKKSAEVATFEVTVPRLDQLAELKWVGNQRQG